MSFQSIPILDYSLIKCGRREEFVDQLRAAITDVGFCYLKSPPVEKEDTAAVIQYAPRLFELEQADKHALNMVNSPHFLGYNTLASEYTKGALDQREQFDFATPYECRWRSGMPDYWKLAGHAQWPHESILPGFKSTLLRYAKQLETLSFEFITLITEALLLPADAFDVFFRGAEKSVQHRLKVVKYPQADLIRGNQGVGPHFDGGFLTFLLQASPHKGLQVQNLEGEWIDAPPLDDTLVVNIGKALEAVTQGLARATSHRVLSPTGDIGPRYSVPFFQGIRQDIRLSQLTLPLRPEILALRDNRGTLGPTDSVNYAEYLSEVSGIVALIGRIKSHPDVGLRHYPERYQAIFGSTQQDGSTTGRA